MFIKKSKLNNFEFFYILEIIYRARGGPLVTSALVSEVRVWVFNVGFTGNWNKIMISM
jgi:hypothetical protein